MADANRVAARAKELLCDRVGGGSILVTGCSNEVTQTEPSPTEISPPGPGMLASIVATTLLVFASTRGSSRLLIDRPPIPDR
jgi:hypothetical protein